MSESGKMLPQDEGFFENILETLPIPTFVVDSDVRIIHANRSATEFLRKHPDEILLRRGGEVMGCLNSALLPGGCGRSEHCGFCVIRGSVGKSIQGGQVHRKKHVLEQSGQEKNLLTHMLVTTSPLHHKQENGGDGHDGGQGEDESFALLILEDITELIQLRGLIPVCAWCKKVRDDSQLWQSVEDYFSSRLDVDFTHGICHECAEKALAEADDAEEKEAT